MNKVISVNLGGIAFQLEESGYDALHVYLAKAQASLVADPDKEEILADIESAIGEKFRVLLGVHKNVVSTEEVESVLREMGPVESGAATHAGASTGSAATNADEGKSTHSTGWGSGSAKTPAGGAAQNSNEAEGKPLRRLYRLEEGAMLFGVCSGLAAFTKMDVLVWRIIFVGLTLVTWGVAVVGYLVLAIILPQADTPTQRAQAQGPIPTAQDFINRAREGYYEAAKGFPSRQARREWKRKFKDDMRSWGAQMRGDAQAGAEAWRRRCDGPFFWGQRSLGSRVALFLFALVFSLAIFGLCIFGAMSLLTTGTFFGFCLPTGMPIWVGILLLVVVSQVLFFPLKLAFGGPCGRHAHGGGCGGIVFLLAAVLGFCWWIYPVQTKATLKEIPSAVREGADAVRDWWQKK